MNCFGRVVIASLFLAFGAGCGSAWSWECSVFVTGPNWVKVGRSINLTASGSPGGGHYSWSRTPGLVPSGSSAVLTGVKSQYYDYARVRATYTTPKGKSCTDTKWVYIHDCEVQIEGPTETLVGVPVVLTASDGGLGGTFSWSAEPGLVAEGNSATFTPEAPGEHNVTVTLTTPDGDSCKATHTINVRGCSLSVAGPAFVDLGEKITIASVASPTEGTFEWGPLDGLVGRGVTAEFTGTVPGEQTIEVRFIPSDPDIAACEASHPILVRDCKVEIDGVTLAAVDEPIMLRAIGLPEGGAFAWSPLEGLLHQGETAQVTVKAPGAYDFDVQYTTPDGAICRASHETTAVKIASLTGPYCANSGTTLRVTDFLASSDPAGQQLFVDSRLTVAPLTVTGHNQISDETIVASIGPGFWDDASTTIKVVNTNNKTAVGTGVNVQVPNQIAEVLSKLGLAEKVKLKLKTDLNYHMDCCSFSKIDKSANLNLFIELGAETGPWPIVGIPLKGVVRKYVALDLLNFKLFGRGRAGIQADHDVCIGKTTVSVGGSITGGGELGGELKFDSNQVVVVEFRVSGGTAITENFAPGSLGKVKATTSWDGLTGTVEGKILVFGTELKITPTSRTYLKADNLMPVEFALPNFYDSTLLN